MDAIPDGLLESILMRLESPVFLVRAAAACKGWRRVIADAAFLRRFRRLHGLTIAGVYSKAPGAGDYLPCSTDELPKVVSFSPSPASGVAGGGRSFALDFLPRSCTAGLGLPSPPRNWELQILESYGSLLLLHLFDPSAASTWESVASTWERPSYLVVCEPATRRSWRLPASIAGYLNLEGAHLLNGDDGNRVVGMSHFRVLFCVRSRGMELQANYSMFSSTTNKCSRVETPMGLNLSRSECIGHTRDAVYWHTGGSTVVALERSTVEWSSSSLPLTQARIEEINSRYIGLVAATAGCDGNARIVVSGVRVAGGSLEVFANHCGEWVLDKCIEIGVGSRPQYSNNGHPLWVKKYSGSPGLVLVSLWVPQPEGRFDCFVVDLETTEIKEVQTNSQDGSYVYLCPCDLPWPPAW